MTSELLATAASKFGASAKSKLHNVAIGGAPEDQLRAPLESFIHDLARAAGVLTGVELVGEATLSHIKSRPDYAVTVNNALAGFIEIKAPGKGADPRRFTDPHDKKQWQRLKALPNLLYTDGGSFSLWRDGALQGAIVHLDGDIETAGARLASPLTLLPLLADFLTWAPTTPPNAKKLAEVTARLCRLLRDEVLDQLEGGNPSLAGLATDWRALLFPDAGNEQFADGYAQAVTFGLLIARAMDIDLKGGIDVAALHLKKTNSLIGTALALLTENDATQKALHTSLGTLSRVLNEVNWHTISKDRPETWLTFYTNGHLHRPTCAQSRMPIDLIVSGNAMSLFHASHAASMMAS